RAISSVATVAAVRWRELRAGVLSDEGMVTCGNYEGDTHDVSLLLLRQKSGPGTAAHRWPWRCLYLRRVRRPVPGDHRGRAVDRQAACRHRQDPHPAQDLRPA